MTAPIIALEGAKRGKQAGNALLGDIYTRRWTTITGTGKKKHEVDHELKVNPMSILIGGAAVGVGAAAAIVTMWATGMYKSDEYSLPKLPTAENVVEGTLNTIITTATTPITTIVELITNPKAPDQGLVEPDW